MTALKQRVFSGGRAYKMVNAREYPDRDAAIAYAIEWYVFRHYKNVELVSISPTPRDLPVSGKQMWDIVLAITQPDRETTLVEDLIKDSTKQPINRSKGERCEMSYKPAPIEERAECPSCQRLLKVQAVMVAGVERSRIFPQHKTS